MRIVVIMQGTNLGGTEQASLRLMLGLKKRGHSCEVVSLNPIGTLGSLLIEHDILSKGLPYSGKGGWRSFFLLRRTLRFIQADALLMTGHNLLAMLALGSLCRERRVLAVHFHHAGVKPPWQWRLIYRIVRNRFQAITFPCDFVRLEAEILYPQIKSLSRTVHDPLLIPKLPLIEDQNCARSILGLPHEVPVIGNAGWLIPRKRFDIFLRVAQKVLQKIPNALFLIAGGGEEKLKLEAFAEQLNIGARVKWLGWQKDLTNFYRSLDVMLFNSDFDAMGLSPLEAVSYGVPLVASVQQGGLKEIINKDDYGFLISTHDIDALAEKIVYFVKNKAEARKTALVCRDKLAQLFNSEDISEEMELLLQGINNV